MQPSNLFKETDANVANSESFDDIMSFIKGRATMIDEAQQKEEKERKDDWLDKIYENDRKEVKAQFEKHQGENMSQKKNKSKA